MNLVRVEGRTSGAPVTWNVSVLNNTLTDGTGNAPELLRVRARDAGVTVCTNVAGNTFSGVSTHIRLREDPGAAMTVQGPTTNTVTPVDMTTPNNGATAVITGTPTFTNGASCPTP